MTGRGPKSFRTEAAIRACAERGLTKRETAMELGVTPSCVAFYIKHYGVEFTSGRVSGQGFTPCRAPRKGKYDDRIAMLAAAGKSRKEMAETIGVEASYVSIRVAALGLDVPHHNLGAVDQSRAETMASMYRAGKTLEEIGRVYGVSRERVRQIIKKEHGLTGSDGGRQAKADARKREQARRRDEKSFARWGCSFSDYLSVRNMGLRIEASGKAPCKNPIRAFTSQRNNARKRGIGWSLSFWDWWRIWQASGKWGDRGRGTGYVMCRFGDDGQYAVGNVYIATGVHNASVQPNNPYRRSHPDFAEATKQWREKIRAASRKRTGGQHRKYTDLPLGVTRHNVTGNFQAQISMSGRNVYLGTFKTTEEASAAYQVALAKRDAGQAAA